MIGYSALGMLPLVSYVFYVLIPLAPIAYVFIKWRAARNNEPHDRDLGIKVVLYYFKTLGYHLILLGAVLLGSGLLKGSLVNDEVKTGVSLILTGAIVYALHALLIQGRFKDDSVRIVPRFFCGFNVLVVGLVAMVCLGACILILFNARIEAIKIPACGLVVYGMAWVFMILEFLRGAEKKPA